MAFGPFYGDPNVLLEANVNLRSLLDNQRKAFQQQITLWNAFVAPLIEGRLYAIFVSWPAANSGVTQNTITTLWVLGMTIAIQRSKYATNKSGEGSKYAEELQEQMDAIFADLMHGTILIPGAVRRGSIPTAAPYTDQRLTMGGIGEKRPQGPRDMDQLFQHGLRHGSGRSR